MEAVEEPPLNNPSAEALKVCVISELAEEITVASEESDVCHKSNGVADTSQPKEDSPIDPGIVITQQSDSKPDSNMDNTENIAKDATIQNPDASSEIDTTGTEVVPIPEPVSEVNDVTTIENPPGVTEELAKDVEIEKTVCSDETKMEEIVIESTVDRVTFQTEILVESNDSEVVETICDNTKNEEHETILGELGTGIELSEALRSSDVTDSVENNNCSGRQEVFNKEELLDILEGNNEEQANYPSMCGDKVLEAQLALQQLSRLKTKSNKKNKSIERFPRKKRQRIVVPNSSNVSEIKEEDSIVKDLVKEWDDEEGGDVDKSNKLVEGNENSLNESQGTGDNSTLQDLKLDDVSVRTSIDSQTTDGNTNASNKSGDETQPQRRLGRVIKKKVIFDPDNPDTFTKSKTITKVKDQVQDRDQSPFKKIKTEQAFQRSKSKSPLSKLQWKKPSPKNIKQNKRLTEVDKLLMDEGAVNMIYQLTPEAPKGKKNMKTKAEFIKKIQSSSTPDTKEMKFRERKKESKYEDSEARRILGGKQRPSLSSSVKSPCISEDFEAHSADDSIIYRRHSSSSYSSSCMSPRRLSDVEMTGQVSRKPQNSSISNHEVNNEQTVEMFMPDGEESVRMEIINKDDCLSIKEKLNSKLNLALKKRKRENSKTDKPMKQKKVAKSEDKVDNDGFKYLSIDIDGKLALICVQKSGSMSNLEMIIELEKAFKIINNQKDVCVTLLLPECGSTYSELDLRSLLDDCSEKRASYAFKMAESVRSLLHTMGEHTKLLCTGVSERCYGVSLALVAMSDVTLASEHASFAINVKSQVAAPIEPGISVLTSYRHLPESALNDMIVFGRRMSAADALQNGLVSRVLWPEKFNDQVLTIVKDIASQPAQNILLKKQIVNLKRSGSESTFLKCLEKERDLFVQYWTSGEGQDLLRTSYNIQMFK